MGWLIAVIVVVVVLVVVAAAVARRRRSSPTAVEPPAPAPPRRTVAPAAPMNDLEAALAKVTDGDGRPIKERIDAESVHVDPLRDPDDTGPLLRRALDSVARHDDAPVADEPAADDSAPPTSDTAS